MSAFEVPPITIEKGADFSASFNIVQENGSILPLSGYTASSKLKKHPSSSISYSFSVVVDDNQDSIEIGMAKSITSILPRGRCYFDIFTTHNSITNRSIFGTAIVLETNE